MYVISGSGFFFFVKLALVLSKGVFNQSEDLLPKLHECLVSWSLENMQMSVLISWLSVGYKILLEACSCWNGTEFPQSSLRGRSYTGGKRCDLPIWGSEKSDWGKMAIQSSPFHPGTATGHRDLLKLLTPCFSYWFQEDNNTKATLLKTSPSLKKKSPRHLCKPQSPLL